MATSLRKTNKCSEEAIKGEKMVTTKPLKKFAELLSRNAGISLTPIIIMMVIMSVMGGVFTSIMGGWKVSAPMTINSHKALFQAEAAAMFALQDAKYRFFSTDASGCPDFPACGSGTRSNPFVVSSVTTTNGTETAEVWIERPYPSINSIDEYPPSTHRGNNDDDTGGNDDDVTDDDDDDSSSSPFTKRYTIIATGKVEKGGTIVAQKQIKVKADIIRSNATEIAPGVQTSGGISGTGGGFGMHNDGGTINTSFGVGTDNNTGPDPETGVVIRPAQTMDENYVKAFAISQGHYNALDLAIGLANDDYPEPAAVPAPSFYYDTPTDIVPNFTYVGRDLTVGSNRKMFGVVWVKRNVVLDGTATMDAIIICEGDITFNGTSEVVGGIIHYGTTLNGNGNPNAITVNDAYFDALSVSIPIVTVKSWQEAVSAN